MRDYQEISDQIRGYCKLKKELEGLSAEALQNSNKEKYSHLLNIEHSLKNQIFDGEELLKIADDIYSKYEEIKLIIDGKNGTMIEDIENILREHI